jgi:hypothetical protein
MNDTTSHNFVWNIDTIGAEGSLLYDVTIINDTLAYASGSIYLRDSTGKSDLAHPYNFIKWNGKNWSYYTLRYFPPGSNGDSAYGPSTCIFARSSSDIWISAGMPFHFDGLRWRAFYNTGAEAANKIWEDPDGKKIYFVGNNGLIAYSPDQGSTWQQVQTGTTLPFQDIWGDSGELLTIASNKFSNGGKYLVQLNSNIATPLNDSIPYGVSLSGIWFKANQEYFLVGDGIFEKQNIKQNIWQFDIFSRQIKYYPFAVRGNSTNDVFISGEAGTLAHWNGATWEKYVEIQNSAYRLWSISVKGNQVIAVGYTFNGSALVCIGKR